MKTRSRFRRGFVVSIVLGTLAAACGWDPSRPFDRDSPQVNEALRRYDAGEAGAAAEVLQDYLTTGGCSEGNIGTPPRLRERSQGSFDLGLTLFSIAETYGHRFGDEEVDAGALDPSLKGLRAGQVECALRVVRAIAEDGNQPVSLRARARYLEGNLLFLTAAYQEAVTAYDHALELVPGMGDAGPIGANVDAGVPMPSPDALGRDAAWNRAVALRRIEDKKDAGPPDGGNPPDAGGDSGKPDENKDGGSDDKNKDAGSQDQNKDGGKNDQSKDAGNQEDGGSDQNKPPPKKDQKDEAQEPPPPSRQSQDDRILDQLENAPTVQQENAKQRGKARKVRGMADK
jgi:hypothetical protein